MTCKIVFSKMVQSSQLVECKTWGQGHWRHSFTPRAALVLVQPKETEKTRHLVFEILEHLLRVPTSSGNHGNPVKSGKRVPCMENHGI